MHKIEEIKSAGSLVGYLHDIEYDKNNILVFQLPRPTNLLSKPYIEGAMRSLYEILPDGKRAIVIGADVNIYELAGADAAVMVLKGII